ncbi:hypothetical protein V0288_18010 [Pannus brasiliensis CCIBt3594]|uniref:Uncharacterized protein n=1 Tax=Pannus brasiliensis CCIBt3594 TaxID=1427578 RepID=A0AAW9QZA5_9CHRO
MDFRSGSPLFNATSRNRYNREGNGMNARARFQQSKPIRRPRRTG